MPAAVGGLRFEINRREEKGLIDYHSSIYDGEHCTPLGCIFLDN